MKLLLTTAALTLCSTIFAQKNYDAQQATPATNAQPRVLNLDQAPRAVICSDTLWYGEVKQYRLGGNLPVYFFSVWQMDDEAISQAYLFEGGTMTLSKVIVPGRVSPTYSTVSSASVAVEVHSIDANNIPTGLIGQTSILFNSTTQTSYTATFSTPLTITGNYAIVLRPTTTNAVVDVIVTDFIGGQVWDEDLCKITSSDENLPSNGQWISPEVYSTGFPQGTWGFDLSVAPIVSYSADAVASATSSTVCLGNEVQFNSTLTPNGAFTSRMMSYQAMASHFITTLPDSTFAWNTNTNSNSFLWGSANPTHTYTTAGTYPTHFFAIGGLYDYCVVNVAGPTITITDPAPLSSQVSITAASEFVCEGGNNIVLQGGPVGGSFSGTFVTGTLFNSTEATAGVHTASYGVTIQGCEIIKEVNITVNPLPVVTFGAINPLCSDGNAVPLTTGLPVGGTYTSPVVVDGVINPLVAGIGSHNVIYSYTENGCEATAEQQIVVEQCLNVDNVWSESIAIFPNPASEKLTIDIAEGENMQFSLIGMDGKTVVYRNSLQAGRNSINLDGIAEGAYLVHIQSDKGVKTQKIFVK